MSDNKNKIRCDVRNCVHHSGKDDCTAKCIEVGTCDACVCGETVCTTFELNERALQD